ncbi:MAG: response regulator, partial [Chlorobiota bacterium]
MRPKTILWVDDEIELLRSHVIFLTEKGYNVLTVTNGIDALETINESEVDLVFLDEMMPGMGGLEVLAKIKDKNPNIPVVMVTKNEEESVMVDAIGSKIDDYLTKPVNPSQVLLVCKKILDKKKISTEYVAKDYLQDFNQISFLLMNQPDHQDWIEIYLKLVNWDIELDAHPEIGLRQTLTDQKRECNKEFGRYVEKHYKNWVH